MTEDTRLMASLKKVKNIRQYVFSGRTRLVRLQGVLAARHTQDLEADRLGLDQDLTVFIDDRGHNGMLAA